MKLFTKLQSNKKRIFWTLCVLFFCIADQRLGSATGESQLVFTNCAVIALALMALAHYPLRSFRKPAYYVWGSLSLACGAVLFAIGCRKTAYPGNFSTMILLVIVFGFWLLRTLDALFVEKVRPVMNKWGLLLFALFFCLTLISRYDNHLSPIFLLAFGLFYLTAFTAKEQQALLNALIDGILLGFFLIQGLALVFRPYDTIRYMGMYANPNMNALLYQAAFCAFLARFCLFEFSAPAFSSSQERCLFTVKKWGCFLLACCMWSLVLFTMCRSALLGMGAAAFVALLWCAVRHSRRKLLHGIRYIGLMLLLTAVCFPAVYGFVRYIPPLFHHPVYFYNDYSEERVHSWDAWDSPKYISWEAVLQENFSRLMDLFPSSWISDTSADTPVNPSSGTLPVDISADTPVEPSPDTLPGDLSADTPVNPSPDTLPGDLSADISVEALTAQIPAAGTPKTDTLPEQMIYPEMQQQEEFKSTSARLSIYRHYLGALNIMGHKEQDNGIQLTEDYLAPHAHNLFLQYAFNYGLPAGLLFLCFIASSGILLLIAVFRSGAKKSMPIAALKIVALLPFAATAAFGMTEMMWRFGMLSNLLLFLLPFFAWTSDIE